MSKAYGQMVPSGNDVALKSYGAPLYPTIGQWVSLYGFDGFRFDLMGILDITTMKQIAQELKAIHPNIYLTEKVGRCLPVLIVTFWLISSTLNNYLSMDSSAIIFVIRSKPSSRWPTGQRACDQLARKVLTANVGPDRRATFPSASSGRSTM